MVDTKKNNKGPSCTTLCKGVDVPTDEEVAVLNEMRRVKDRVRALKRMISEIRSKVDCGEGASLLALETELAQLKEAWNELEAQREKTARERMILLGHEEP